MPGFAINNDGIPAKDDPQRSYRWQLIDIYGQPVNKNSDLAKYVSISAPGITFAETKAGGSSIDYKFAKKATFSDIDVVFYAFRSLATIVDKWQQKVWTIEEGLQTDYKSTIEFHETDNLGKIVTRFTMFGAWPKQVIHSQYNMESEEIKKITVKFAYDYFKIEGKEMLMSGSNNYGSMA